MKSHLQKRRLKYYARLSVPEDLRDKIGKRELIKSLQTSDLKIANAKVLKVIGEWKLGFEALRGTPSALEELASAIRLEDDHTTTPDAPMTDKEAYIEHIADDLPLNKEKLFRDIAMGRATPFLLYKDRFLEQWNVDAKTKAMAETVLKRVSSIFQSLEMVTKPLVVKMVTHDQTKANTKGKNYGFVRQYWNYLQDIGAINSEAKNPFAGLKLGTKSKSSSTGKKRTSFQVDEIRALVIAAKEKEDQTLLDLIMLGSHTGARIEELCSLRIDSVTKDSGINCLVIEDAKTEAGNRLVPIHPAIASVVNRLIKESEDGYLLTNLGVNKYGDRSNAIGKRFGRLKESLGHGPEKVFHSIRKTVITLLENAGVTEGIAADLVGHEKATMTYGLYSSGTSTKIKYEALKKISIYEN